MEESTRSIVVQYPFKPVSTASRVDAITAACLMDMVRVNKGADRGQAEGWDIHKEEATH